MQVNPLSPYLFLLVSDGLSKMISRATDTKQLQGVRMSDHGSSISHLFFADDTLIFLKADTVNCRNLGSLIQSYCSASGQVVNLHKSCVFFSANTPLAVAEELGNVLGIPVVFLSYDLFRNSSYMGPVQMSWARLCERSIVRENSRVKAVHSISGW